MDFLQEIVIISGRSGAGKSTVSKSLEDMGYFVVDNLPPQLLDDLLLVADSSKRKIKKIVVIVDVRETEFLELVPAKWQELDKKKYNKKLIFLDATDQQLIDRYQETKRRHPLDDGCGVRAALKLETKKLAAIRRIATKEIFTDKLNAHELRNLINDVMANSYTALNLTLLSFGFKNGVPSELDLCFDVRFLSNPHYLPELKPKTGLDKEVYDYVLSLPPAKEFLDRLVDMIEFLYPRYLMDGRSSLTIAIGCTGGQHRSTALVKALQTRLIGKIDRIRVEHRELDRHT